MRDLQLRFIFCVAILFSLDSFNPGVCGTFSGEPLEEPVLARDNSDSSADLRLAHWEMPCSVGLPLRRELGDSMVSATPCKGVAPGVDGRRWVGSTGVLGMDAMMDACDEHRLASRIAHCNLTLKPTYVDRGEQLWRWAASP